MDTAAVDHVLTTTRAVRRRLDLERAVPHDLLLECLRLATQAPTSGGRERCEWVVVTDTDQRAALAHVYREASLDAFADAAARATDPAIRRIYEGATYLAHNLHRVPVHVIPCIEGRVDGGDNRVAASFYGSILPAAWSFQLALRSRGLGSCWTTVHLRREHEAAQILGIPESHTQVALLPVAYTVGGEFRPAVREPVEGRVHVDHWGEQSWQRPPVTTAAGSSGAHRA